MSTPCLIVDIPGPVGPAGADGADGTNGVNAWTTVALAFVMPAEGASVVVSVVEASWMAIGQKVFVGDPAGAARGTFEVVAIAANSVTLNNLEDTATDAYLDNSAPATVFPIGSAVSPSGLQGPAGVTPAGSAPDDATYITQTPNGNLSAEQALSALATGFMYSTFGTGVVTTAPNGTANLNVVIVDMVAGLTAGDVVFATALGVETKTAANTRIALGLVKGTANTNTPQVDDVAGLTNGELIRATAAGIESISLATAQAMLGIGSIAITTKIASYSAAITDNVILCDATAGAIVIGLPAVATATGKNITVKKIDASANTVTIDGNLGELIDGAATQVISAQWTAIDMVCNGSAWYIV